MFSEQKWNILKCLSKDKYSPLQLAQLLNTTIANISQQLRLLEAANLVKKEKIRNRERGKPRALFSLSNDCAYIIPTMSNFADKKLLRVSEHQKIILKIWFLENAELQKELEKIYWKLEPYMNSIHAILLKKSSRELIVVSEKPAELEKAAKSIGIRVVAKNEMHKSARLIKELSSIDDIYVLHDRNSTFSGGLK